MDYIRSGLHAEVESDSLTQKQRSGDHKNYGALISSSFLDDITSISIGTDGAQDEANGHQINSTQSETYQNDDKWKKIKRMFRSYKFHLLFWPANAISSLRMVCTTNIGTFLMSFHIDNYSQMIFHIHSILCIAMKLSLSALYHFFTSRVPRVGVLTAGAFLSMQSFLLGLYYMQDLNILIVLIILWTLAGGVTLSLLPAILASVYGKDTSAVSSGIVNAIVGVIQLAAQEVFSGLYDRQITDGSNACYGVHCFYAFFVSSAVFSGICLVLMMIYMYLQRRDTSKPS